MKTVLVLPPLPEPAQALARLWEASHHATAQAQEISLWLPGYSEMQAAALPLPTGIGTLVCSGEEVDAAETYVSESILAWLEERCKAEPSALLLVYGSLLGQELAPRLAARLGCGCFSEAVRVWEENGVPAAEKKVCSSHLNWRMPLAGTPFVASIARGRAKQGYAPCPTPPTPVVHPLPGGAPAWLLESHLLAAAEENPLETAALVLVGGRGLGNRAGYARLAAAARALAGAAGLTRPAALNGWGRLEDIIGQSGLRVAPQVCIAFGASGAAAFLAGVEDAKTLVAVNTDPGAPIFKHADYGILADAGEVLEALTAQAQEGE